MRKPKTSAEVMRDMNDLAKRLGRYPATSIWDTPPSPGSILDVPMTPEIEARIRSLDAMIAELEQRNAAAAAAQQSAGGQGQAPVAPAVDVASVPTAVTPEA